MSTIKAKDHSE